MRKITLLSVLFFIVGFVFGQTVYQSNLSSWSGGWPTDWNGSKTNIALSNVTEITTGATYGTSMASLKNTTTSHKRFTTQPVAVVAGKTYDVEMWVKADTGNIRTAYVVHNSTTYSSYNAYDSLHLSSAGNLVKVTQQLTIAAGVDTVEFIVSIINTNNTDGIFIDSVAITEQVCDAPTALTATNITATTADLGWTENGTATVWDIEWGAAGFTPTGTPNIVGTTTNPHNLTGLTAQTPYEFYVRAMCAASDSSAWAGPFSFSTPCAVITPDHTEPFNTFVPNSCWDEADGGDLISGPTSIGSSPWGAGTAIGNTAKINLYTDSRSDWILSPYFDLSAGGYEIVLDVAVTDWNSSTSDVMGSDDSVRVVFSEDGLTWDTLMVFTVADNLSNSLTTFSTLIPSTANNVQFGILATDGPNNDSEDYDFHVDNFIIRTPPSCPAPTALTATNITATTADLGWTENGSATNWQIEWDTTGFVPGTGNMVTTTNNPYNVTGLTPFTSYEFYVRSICGTNDTSTWSGPYTFSYNYCVPVYSNGCSFGARVNNVITTSAVTNINNTATECANSAGYTDYSSTDTLEVAQGATISVNVGVSNYSGGVKVWIDYNQDAIFDVTEIVTQSASTISAGNSHTANITVPVSALLGETRMRVRVVESTTTFDACSSQSYGEAEDYTVMILPAPSCLPPSALTAINITATTADLGWTEMGTATNWQVEWDTTGFVPGTGNVVVTTNNPYNVTGLTPFTSYEFYVRSICGTNDTSAWSGPYTFSFNHCAPSYDYGCSYGATIDGVTTTNATTNINNSNSACASGGIGYTDYSSTHTLETAQGTTFDINVQVTEYDAGVKVWIDYNQDAIFDVSEIVAQSVNEISAGSNFIASITVPVSALLGETRMRVRIVEGSTSFDPCALEDYGEAEDYKVMILPAPSCLPPSALTVTNLTSTTADLGWTEIGTATNWQVEWDTTGFVPGTGNIAVTTNNPYNITGLTPFTSYEFYVRSICGTNDTSTWSGPYVFTTPCNTVTTFPFLEDFETTSTTRDCWTQIEELGSASWTYATGSSGGAITTAYSGTENARFVSQSGTNSPIVKLVSPILDLSGVNSPELAFFYGQEIWFSDQNELKVYYRVSVDSAWVQIAHYTSDVAVWTADTLTLPNPSATYQIAFEGINNWGRANVVDDVEVYDAFTCSDPSNLTAFNIQPTNVMLDWTENGTATNWNIEWGMLGFTLGTGNPQAVAAKPYLLQGLTPGTAYDYYVQADCGMGDTSNWVGPYTFTTPPCMPIGLNLGADTTLCANQNITLDAGAGPYTYTWSTGGMNQTEVIDTTLMGGNGTYNVSVTVVDNVSGCIYTDDINITFQTCTDIDELNGANAFNIYPNPTKGILNVSMASTTANTVLTIVDVQGKVVFTKTNFNTSSGVVETIDLSGNDKGIYFVNFTNEQTSIVKKVVLH